MAQKMGKKEKIIQKAMEEGRTTLSEYESKILLTAYDIPVAREILVQEHQKFLDAVHKIGYPVVIKGSAPELAHKTEQGLVAVDVRNDEEAETVYQRFMNALKSGEKGLLVQEMVKGSRELMVGMTRDAQFGPCVMFGLGGIFTEILKDVSFRVAPITKRDAFEMMEEIKARKILDEIRGMPAADREALSEILIKIGQVGLENESVKEIDVNPLILQETKPVAVDALVVLASGS
jgi:acyl-CoA synthetase (NDP forming)